PGVWRALHAQIRDFLRRHSATTTQVGERYFTGKTVEARRRKASRWLVRERQRKRVSVVGVMLRKDTGRPEIIYGRKAKDSEHEVWVAELEVILGHRIERGAKVGRT